MRVLLTLALAMLSTLSLGDTTAVESLIYDGSVGFKELNLTTEKTRTEYRQIRVPATCYRTDYRRVCEQAPPRCHRVCDRRGVCRNRCTPGRRICRNIPVSVPYRCMRTETRRYEVFDYYVETRAKFQFITPNQSDVIRENVQLSVRGERETLSVNGSRNYFIYLDDKQRTERMGAGTKYIDINYRIRLVPASTARDVLSNGIRNVSLRSGVLNFTLGAGFNLNEFTQRIRLYRNRRLGNDPLIADRYLNPSQVSIIDNTYESQVSIDLRSLGVNLPSKLRVILNTDYTIDKNRLLNQNEIKTEASANWVFR